MSFRKLVFAVLALSSMALPAMAADPIKIGYIDPLSGSFANVGEQGQRTLQMLIERINADGGALGRPFELVALDSKANPQEALLQFQQLADAKVALLFPGELFRSRRGADGRRGQTQRTQP